MPNIKYTYQGQTHRLSKLYKVVKKQTEKKEYISSVEVDYYGIPARIVFVRNRNGNKKMIGLTGGFFTFYSTR